MIVNSAQPYFFDRVDAGQRLAKDLMHYRGGEVVVFAVPRGGVPVAVEVARVLGAPLSVVIPRKIPIPAEPEAGYGAVTEDGAVVLNEPLVKRLNLTRREIERHAEEVRAEIQRRSTMYQELVKPVSTAGKIAIVIDDGLASGYTMLAAVKSVRRKGAARVVVAVPVASSTAWNLLKAAADEVVCLVIAYMYHFAVASFYRTWHDLTDEEVAEYLDAYSDAAEGQANG